MGIDDCVVDWLPLCKAASVFRRSPGRGAVRLRRHPIDRVAVRRTPQQEMIMFRLQDPILDAAAAYSRPLSTV